MTTLMRYILREHLRMLTLCISGLTAVYFIVDFVEKVRRFVNYQPQIRHIAWYFVLKLPSIVFLITPLAVLMATLLSLVILSRNNEITAMRSSGISLYWVAIPFLGVAQVVSLLMLWSSDSIIPAANQQAEVLREVRIEGRSKQAFFQDNEIWVRLGDQTLMKGDLAEDASPRLFGVAEDASPRLLGVSLYRLGDDFRVRELLNAKELVYRDGQWVLNNGTRLSFTPNQTVQSQAFETLPINLNQKPEDFKSAVRVNSDALSLRELASYVERLRQDGYNPARFAADLFGRTAFPFVCLIMALIGISLSLMETGVRGAGLVKGVGYSLLIGFLYWTMHSAVLALGRTDVVPPLLAGWTANLAFLALGGYLFLHVRQ